MSKCQVSVCSECPYRKNSQPGYFGGNDPAEYRDAIVNDVVVPCHTRNRYLLNGTADLTDLQPCIGHLSAQLNSCKISRLPEVVTIQNAIRDSVDLTAILNVWQFDQHHGVVFDPD